MLSTMFIHPNYLEGSPRVHKLKLKKEVLNNNFGLVAVTRQGEVNVKYAVAFATPALLRCFSELQSLLLALLEKCIQSAWS